MSFVKPPGIYLVMSDVTISINSVSDFRKSFYRDNQKLKRDPHSPALRSKGEKARNRRNRVK